MTRDEAQRAARWLAERIDRHETIALDTGGVALTVFWKDGGQQIYHSIDAVRGWIVDRLARLSPEDRPLRLGHIGGSQEIQECAVCGRPGLVSDWPGEDALCVSPDAPTELICDACDYERKYDG